MSLPILESLAAAGDKPSDKIPMRMLCVGNNFGFVPSLFFPTGTGSDYEIPELLASMASYRDQFTIFSQLDHGSEGVGGHGGVHAFLSGVLAKNSKGYAEGNVTFDQKAAAYVGPDTRYPSLQLACGSSSGNRLSWSASGVAIPSVEDPSKIFAMLFQKTDPMPQAF